MIFRCSLVLMLSAVTMAEAQERWIDTIPAMQVACVRGAGSIDTLALPGKMRQLAKDAGTVELGSPFITQKQRNAADDIAATDWEMCAVHKELGKPVAGLERRTIPPSAGSFQVCAGGDSKTCAESLRSWISRTISDFDVPLRVVPLVGFSESKRAELRAGVASLLLETPDKLVAVTSPDEAAGAITTESPAPVDSLDRQLFGDDKTPRSLLTVPTAAALDKDEGPAFNGLLVYAPVSDSQKALLEATK